MTEVMMQFVIENHKISTTPGATLTILLSNILEIGCLE